MSKQTLKLKAFVQAADPNTLRIFNGDGGWFARGGEVTLPHVDGSKYFAYSTQLLGVLASVGIRCCATVKLMAAVCVVTAAATVHAQDVREDVEVLKLLPSVKLFDIRTGAGALHCARALCRTIAEAHQIEGNVDEESRHSIVLAKGGRPISVTATNDFGYPTYRFGSRTVSGGDVYVPGNGCLYVHQAVNSEFPLTKTYCLSKRGVLERVNQLTYPLNHTLIADTQLVARSAPAAEASALGSFSAGTPIRVVAAVVNELDDVHGTATWFKVIFAGGIPAWVATPSRIAQCDKPDDPNTVICYNGD